jgi:hypothetical protein
MSSFSLGMCVYVSVFVPSEASVLVMRVYSYVLSEFIVQVRLLYTTDCMPWLESRLAYMFAVVRDCLPTLRLRLACLHFVLII